MPTILVVDNEAPVRKLLTEVLRKAGYQALAASSGREAVAAAARHSAPIELLIADIVMSGMGGAELYAWLKTERPEIKVIFISGFMNREPLAEGAFLKKPFKPGELLALVREMLAPGPAA